MTERHDVLLAGCQSEPLAGYLKAIAVLRLVAEQADPSARGTWGSRGFTLTSSLDRERLGTFFLERYRPTPILAPWNGGSGFFAGDQKAGIDAIVATKDVRFAPYRAAIGTCRRVLASLALKEKPEKEAKEKLIEVLRAELDDVALQWLDVAVVLTSSRPVYPRLLGTGGNDGNLEFSNNQMQRLAELLLSGDRAAVALLEGALFDVAVSGLASAAIGQFHPAGAGGVNASSRFKRNSRTNPWDYVLALEGALCFGAVATRRLESGASEDLAFPFMVQASGAGYASDVADEGKARQELWLPLWSRPSSYEEVAALLGEGRAKVGRRAARTGIDFARALGSLGVDRGIDAFTRFGFHQRFGRSFLAVPLGRWSVCRSGRVDLLAELDRNRWLDRVRQEADHPHAPAAFGTVARTIDRAVMAFCREPESHVAVGDLLVALGATERALGTSLRFTRSRGLSPSPQLSVHWLRALGSRTSEARLALALASTGIRGYLGPVLGTEWVSGDGGAPVWTHGDLAKSLIAMLVRREIEATQDRSTVPSEPARVVPLSDLSAFIDGAVDDRRIEDLVRGLALVDWSAVGPWNARDDADVALPGFLHAVMRLAHSRRPDPLADEAVPRTPGLLMRGAAGDAVGCSRLAIRRLKAAGLVLPIEEVAASPTTTRRAIAALAFPISQRDSVRLFRAYVKPVSAMEETHDHPDP